MERLRQTPSIVVVSPLELPQSLGCRQFASVDEALARAPRRVGGVVILDARQATPEAVSALAERCRGSVVLHGPPSARTLRLVVDTGAQTMISGPLSERALGRLRDGLQKADWTPQQAPPPLIGSGNGTNELIHWMVSVAPTNGSVLILGETGTGKEVVAHNLHRLSLRNHRPFVAVNCAAIPENLLESELFGHERGAFTGAVDSRAGYFEQADGGTLFLDEIAEIPPAVQVKLLRVLQEQTFQRLGSNKPTKVDVRVIAATNADIDTAVANGAFRADLLYRLRVFSCHLSPLRKRPPAEIDELWQHFVHQFAEVESSGTLDQVDDVSATLQSYSWPGNVRELANVARHAVVLAGASGTIERRHLPAEVRVHRTVPAGTPELRGRTLAEIERQAILDAYNETGSARDAAERLDVSVRKIYYRLKQYREEGHLDEGNDDTQRQGAAVHHKVFLVEDDPDIREVLQELLEDDGYEVVALANGDALLDHLGPEVLFKSRTCPGDAIITDLRMPGIDGFELLEGVRAQGWEIPVIMISAYCDSNVRSRAESLGADAVLAKPLDFNQLQGLLTNYLTAPATRH